MARFYLGLLFTFFFVVDANAQWTSGRPSGHAPIQIMGDHTHNAGEVMFSYRYMYMDMDGNRDGTDDLSNSEILMPSGSYMVVPEQMSMHMHMIGAMYATSDNLTLMAMIGILQSSMKHVTASGGQFTTESSGFTDVQLSALYKLLEEGNSRAHANIGISLPTGSIDEQDQTPMSGGNEVILPYPMQIGSGSVEFSPGFTFLTQTPRLSLGTQVKGVIHLNENDKGYKLGNRFHSFVWMGYDLGTKVSPLLSLEFSSWGNIKGEDADLNPNMVHTADPDLKSGSKVDVGIGLNLVGPDGPLHDLRLAINYDFPIYQNLKGPQMKNQGDLTLGLQYTIH